MSNSYYFRLSRDNIRKNAKMYIPYMFTCILMTAMLYIIRSLSQNPDFASFAHGAETLPKLLQYGSYVTAAFAVVIIFYSNSFILQRRNREFGLLNILGMEKRHIAKLLLIETVHIAVITFVLGLLVGIGLEMLMDCSSASVLKCSSQDCSQRCSATRQQSSRHTSRRQLFSRQSASSLSYLSACSSLHFVRCIFQTLLSFSRAQKKARKNQRQRYS